MSGSVIYTSGNLKTAQNGINGGLTGHTWKIDLYDINSSGIAAPIELDLIGEPQLAYESQSDKIYSTIKGSSLEFTFSITNSTVENWFINTFLQAKEERFIINLFLDGSLFWSGYPLFDLGEQEDAAYPFGFTIKATDCIARLKGFTFDYAVANDNFQSLTEFIGNILEKTALTAYLNDIGSSANLFSTCVNWYEFNMSTTYTDDPLAQSYLRRFVFSTIDENQSGKYVAMTYYDVLDKILLAFNARIILSDGYYKVISISQYDSASVMYERCYIVGAYTTPNSTNTVTSTWKTTIAQSNSGGFVEKGNKWGFYPAAKNVKRTLNYPIDSQNLLASQINTLACTPSTATWNASTALNTFSSDGHNRLRIRIPFTFQFPSTQYQVGKIRFNITLKIGGYYLSSSGHYWVSTASPIVATLDAPIPGRGMNPSNPSAWSFSGVFEFETPDIPSGTYPSSGNSISISPQIWTRFATTLGTYTWCSINNPGYNISQTFGTALPQSSLFDNAINVSAYINSELTQLDDGIFGEFYQGSNLLDSFNGFIYTKKSGSTYTPSTGKWKIGGSGTALTLNQTLVQEICAILVFPIKRYQGSIISAIKPHYKLKYGNDYYIINGGSYGLLSQCWNAEWIKVTNIRSSVSIDTQDNNSINDVNADVEIAIGGLSNPINNVGNQVGMFLTDKSIGSISSDLSGTITSLPIDSLLNPIYSGDIIKIYPLFGTNLITATATANAAIGATSISISSLTLSENVLQYSTVSLGAYTATGFYPASGKRLILSNTLTLSGTDGSTVNFGAGGSIAYQDQVNSFTKNNDVFGTTQYTALRTRGTVSSAAGGGLYFGSYNAQYGGIWSDQTTPASTNYLLISKGNAAYFNSNTTIYYAISDSPKASMNSTGFLIGGDPSSYNPAAKLDIVGALNSVAMYVNVHNDHTGSYRVFEISEASGVAKIGFFGATSVAKQTAGSSLTNNITSGGTSYTLGDWDVSVAPDASISRNIRNDMYQLGQVVKTILDALRSYGLLT
jgi:hypothetical protein